MRHDRPGHFEIPRGPGSTESVAVFEEGSTGPAAIPLAKMASSAEQVCHWQALALSGIEHNHRASGVIPAIG